MANWSDLKAAVASIVKTNGNKEITGQLLQNVLNNIISNVGENATFAGIATPGTNPGTPDGNVFYIASTEGVYSNFNGVSLGAGEVCILLWKNGSWSKNNSGFASKEELKYVALSSNTYPLEYGSLHSERGDEQNSLVRGRTGYIDSNLIYNITSSSPNYKVWAWLYDKNGNFIERTSPTALYMDKTIPYDELHKRNYNIRITIAHTSDDSLFSLEEARNALVVNSVNAVKELLQQQIQFSYIWNQLGDIPSDTLNSGVLNMVLYASLDITPKIGYRYMFSAINKKENIEESTFNLYERNIDNPEDYSSVIGFSKTHATPLYKNVYLYVRGKSRVIVDWDAIRAEVGGFSINLGHNVELNQRVFKQIQGYDAESEVNTLKSWIAENQITFKILSNNLHNHNSDRNNTSMNDSGNTYVEGADYHLTDFIEVEPGVEYSCNKQMRKIWDYEEIGKATKMTQSVSTYTPIGKYVRFIYSPTSTRVCFGKTGTEYTDVYEAKYLYKGDELLNNASKVIEELFNQIQYRGSGNLLDPNDIRYGQILDESGGLLHTNAQYDSSQLIRIDGNVEYKGNVRFRRICFYNSKEAALQTIDNISVFTAPDLASFVVLSWDNRGISPNDVKFGKSDENISGEYGIYPHDKLGRRIALKEEIAYPQSGTNVLSLQNSDKILFVGSSSTESHYTLRNKSWFMKLNDELDWLFVTYAFSGNSASQITAKLKSNMPSPTADGLKPSKIYPSYVHVGQFGNMSDDGLNDSTSEKFIESNRKLMLAAQGVFNAKIIVGTGYHDYDNYHLETALKSLADEFNADFIPWGYYNNKVMRSVNGYRSYKGFYGAAHPGTRTNNFYYQEAMNFFKLWQQPKQSIKMFKPRNGVEDYKYRTNKERAKKFYSIQVGEQSLSDSGAAYYDRLEPTSAYLPFAKNQSEYNMLMQGKTVSFGNVLLVEFILPYNGVENSEIYIKTDATDDLITSLYDNINDVFEEVYYSSIEGGIKIEVKENKYYSFDKIKLLLTGGNISLNNIYIHYSGGKPKQYKEKNELLYFSGEKIYGKDGFSDTWDDDWNGNNVSTYKQKERYGDEFVDIPSYINAGSNNILELAYSENTSSKIEKAFTKEELYGNRNHNAPLHLRVEVYARMWCKIYDPERFASWNGEYNPFTDQPILTTDSYDYGTIQIGVKGVNGKTALIESNVGMFWSRIPFDIYLPPFSGSQTISVGRKVSDINSHLQMEIVDVTISVI